MLALMLVVLIGSGVSRAAVPAVTITATASPQALHYPERLSFTVAVQITTGAAASVVFIGTGGPAWPDLNVIGSPIGYGYPASLQGPGGLGFFQADPGPVELAGPRCTRGDLGNGGEGWTVHLPADTTTTLVLAARAFGKPWPGTDYTPVLEQAHFEVYGPGPHNVGPLSVRAAIPVPPITMSGPSGVHITLATRPAPRHTGLLNANLKVGRRVTIFGRTSPIVRNAPIKLQALLIEHPGLSQSTRLITLGTVRTGAHGRFHRSWTPPRVARYQLLARYDKPVAPLLRDSSCDLRFTATR